MKPGPPGATGGAPMLGGIPGGTTPAMLGPAVIIRGMSARHTDIQVKTVLLSIV